MAEQTPRAAMIRSLTDEAAFEPQIADAVADMMLTALRAAGYVIIPAKPSHPPIEEQVKRATDGIDRVLKAWRGAGHG